MAGLRDESVERLAVRSQHDKQPWALLVQVQPEWMGCRPNGALSRLVDDVWYLGDRLPGASESSFTVSWVRRSECDFPHARYWTDLAKALTYHVLESGKTGITRTTSLALVARDVFSFVIWLSVERGCRRVEDFSTADRDAYETYLRSLNVSASRILTRLITVRYFWTLRDELGVGFAFDPYVQRCSMKGISRKLGKQDGSTPTIPPVELFRLINDALQLVESSDGLSKLIDRVIAHKEAHGGARMRQGARRFHKNYGLTYGEVADQIRLVYAASIFIVLLLSGERKHELASTKFVDLVNLVEHKEKELLGQVRKTSPTLTGTKTSRPAIPQLLDAVERVLQITTISREHYSGDKAFIRDSLSMRDNGSKHFELDTGSVYRLLDRLATHADVSFKIRPHMLRRAFALLWAWRFELGEFEELALLLRHNGDEFIRAYVEDTDIWQFVPETQVEFAMNVMEDALYGRREFVGGVEKTLRRLRAVVTANATVLSPEALSGFVRQLFKQHEFRVIPQADGYCFMSARRGARAKCSLDGKNPDYVNRDESHCVACGNFGVDESGRERWEARRAAHKRALNATDVSVVRWASEEGVRRADRILGLLDRVGRK